MSHAAGCFALFAHASVDSAVGCICLRPALRCQRPNIRNGGSAGGAVHCSIADVLGQCQFYAEWAAHVAAADAHWHARAQVALSASGPASCLSARSPGSRHDHTTVTVVI